MGKKPACVDYSPVENSNPVARPRATSAPAPAPHEGRSPWGRSPRRRKRRKSLRSECLRLPPSVPVAPEPPSARHRRTRRAPTPESRTPSLTVTPSPLPRRTHKKKRSRRDDTSSSSSPSSESDSEDSEDVRRRRAAKMVRPRFVPSRHGTLIDDRLKPRRARSHTPRPPTFHPERRPRSSPRA